MESYIYWFVLALMLLGLEMATGTFFMLVLALALGVGGVAALLGVSVPWQLAFSAVAGVIGTVLVSRMRSVSGRAAVNQSLDIGQYVKVLTWREDGSARVFYRGAEWDAEPESAGMARDGVFYIKEIRGTKLILTQHKS